MGEPVSSLDDLPPLREVVEQYGLNPKKALGQNFLFDLNLTGRIARVAGQLEGHRVIEVGPGPGGLTRAMLAEGASEIIAIERDERCMAALAAVNHCSGGRLGVVNEDALKADYAALLAGSSKPELPVRIIANLPYNVATPLFIGWVLQKEWPPFYSSMTLMFQKEVAERICAGPGERHYGRLGVLAGWRLDARIAFDVDARNFTPPPKVTSAIVHATPKENPLPCKQEKLELVTRLAFGQRRKMLRASLKSLGGASLLEKANIDPTRRAETLSVEEFVHLANLV